MSAASMPTTLTLNPNPMSLSNILSTDAAADGASEVRLLSAHSCKTSTDFVPL